MADTKLQEWPHGHLRGSPAEWLLAALLVRAAERSAWRERVRDARDRYEVETWLAENRYLSIFPPAGWTCDHERYWREQRSGRAS